ncbi:MAG: DUF2975 domain-containing protein [Ferrovibrionaceae bacterium]
MTRRLLRLGRLLSLLGWLGIVLLIAVPSANWLLPLRPAESAIHHLSLLDRALAWMIVAPPYLVVASGLGQLLAFCRRIREHKLFHAAAVRALNRFGWSLIAASALVPVSRVALGLLFASPIDPIDFGSRYIFGAFPLLAVAVGMTFGFVLVLFAAILDEAVRLAEENASFL